MITRDTLQGFLDGHKIGHPLDCVKDCLSKWLKEHPTYPSDDKKIDVILSDLESYRI